MVADLLSRETKEWNKGLVERLLPDLADHVFSIRPSLEDIPDSYIWTQNKSGIYTTKSGYYTAHQTHIQSTPSLLNAEDANWDWKKHIWSPKLLPKIKLFMWKCARNDLPTGDNLRKRGIQGNTTCRSCGSIETIDHILLHCRIATTVWELCPWSPPMHCDSTTSFREALSSSISTVNLPPVGTTMNLFHWICWTLWTSSNQLLFENRHTSPTEILSKAIASLKEWEAAQATIPTPHATIQLQKPIQITSTAVILCNTDAAWAKDSRFAGLAWIFTNQAGQEISKGCSFQEHVSSPLMAEALAVRGPLLHAVAHNFDQIWIRSDCKGLIQAIIAKQGSIELFGVLNDIESLVSSSFISFQVLSFLGILMGRQICWQKTLYVLNSPFGPSLCTKAHLAF